MRWLKYLGYSGGALVVLLLAAGCLGWAVLRASLPRLDGVVGTGGLGAPVRVARDARGVPTLSAANRIDLAWATGFVHAQDRFFQMDLSRRLAAGELAELFGAVAVEEDLTTRRFRFRHVAREVLAAATPAQHAVLEAYTRGVNAGLADLGSWPWEYWVLRQAPSPWRPEDSVLVVYAMWWDLQARSLQREILRREIDARLKGAVCANGWKCALGFLYPAGTSWDAPDVAAAPAPPEAAARLPIPGPEVLDIRDAVPPGARATRAGERLARHPADSGSNSWAVEGRLTSTGAALIASDMHLGQRVPPVWYHARLRSAASSTEGALDLDGVTLPGAPLLVAGSNGHIAWGFTNSYGDWVDVQGVPCASPAAATLATPAGGAPPAVVREQIRVRGAGPETLEVRSGPLGVLLRFDAATHTCWFGAWLAQQAAATNLNLMALERVTSVAQALSLAPEIGIPHQNAVIGDAAGHIAWTVFGRIPEDTGPGRARGGPWTTAADQPRIVDPPLGRLWTANAQVATDERSLQLIGGDVAGLGAEYDLGARAGQIRDDLLRLGAGVTPADMLRIQLDDRALFLERWRTLLLSVLDASSLEGQPRRAEFRRLVREWNPRASVDSVGYRLVRAFRQTTLQAVWEMLLTGLGVSAEEGAEPPAQFEGPLWEMVTAQPLHLLVGQYASWPQFLRMQADATIETLGRSCPELARCTWGKRNLVRIRHPLSRALPWLAWLIDMRPLELPGDHDMPRVQDGAFGASERFAVSPGHEAQGYLHIPGGQSGHPLSPYYRAGFMQWALGKPLPFEPGPPQHVLTLTP